MKKKIMKAIFMVLGCVMATQMNPNAKRAATAEAKAEYMQDVALDEAHFPDERFRKKLSYYIDKNKDEILSREERESIYYLELDSYTNGISRTWYQDMKYMRVGYNMDDYAVKSTTKYSLLLNFQFDEENYRTVADDRTIDLTGIEYFFNLQEVKTDKYEWLTGSFQNNASLRKIWIGCSKPGDKSYDAIQKDFPVSQLTYIHMENVAADTLDVRKTPNLQVLRLILPDGSDCRLSELNLSANKKLKELELGNILPAKLNLTKNKKLISVKIYSGKCKTGQKYGENLVDTENGYYRYYLPGKNKKCTVTFAKTNRIKTLHYFTANKKIDMTRLTKLEDFQTLKSIKAKVKSSWIRKTFTKKKWGCAVVKSGKFLQKIKAKKKGKYTMI